MKVTLCMYEREESILSITANFAVYIIDTEWLIIDYITNGNRNITDRLICESCSSKLLQISVHVMPFSQSRLTANIHPALVCRAEHAACATSSLHVSSTTTTAEILAHFISEHIIPEP